MSEKKPYQMYGLTYYTRAYLNNAEYDLISDILTEHPDLEKLNPQQALPIFKQIRPILQTYITKIIDEKGNEIKERDIPNLPAELTWQLLLDILRTDFGKIMAIIAGTTTDQKKN